MREVARAEYAGGYATAYDARGLVLTHIRCDGLVGYGPEGFVTKRSSCYWVHKASGVLAMPPLIPYNFEKEKWNMHDSYLRIMC